MFSESNPSKNFQHCNTPILRRGFIAGLAASTTALVFGQDVTLGKPGSTLSGIDVPTNDFSEDLFAYMRRRHQGFDATIYKQLLGAGNEFKEGDQSLGLSATNADSRKNARRLLSQTRIGELQAHSVFEDELSTYIHSSVDVKIAKELADWSMADLHRFLLEASEDQIKRIMPGLASDIIAFVVKLMSNEQLTIVGAKLFNPLPGSRIGAQGYLGARVQPNSPTDNTDDIQWQVFNSFAFAVGDVLLGSNPVSSEVESVAAVEMALADVLETFDLDDVMPHCVLAHVDVQAEVESAYAGSTALWFQSLAGVEDANATFDISVPKMTQHAASRTGKYGLYFETGQGADATNGHGKGFDMVIHEARKYGFARALKREVAQAQERAGQTPAPWVHVNDVAGFIGPEIFRTREQLVRCCLEDIVMGKLHGLTIGLDVCSTLHMEVDLDDLEWCIDQIMPACPAYLMALPTKNDPMLSYLTTAFQDHVRIREKFGYRVSDQMWQFFQSLGVIDTNGRPTKHFGQPTWVYLQYRRRQRDQRPDAEILAEAQQKLREVRDRGIFIAEGYGNQPWDLEPTLDRRIRHLYEDSKQCIWAELHASFVDGIHRAVNVKSQSKDRRNYILHPPTGETLEEA
ncbi:MAG: ethanolamine ammonia-lyase subunit EutB, partial [Bythopirellula sp.]